MAENVQVSQEFLSQLSGWLHELEAKVDFLESHLRIYRDYIDSTAGKEKREILDRGFLHGHRCFNIEEKFGREMALKYHQQFHSDPMTGLKMEIDDWYEQNQG